MSKITPVIIQKTPYSNNSKEKRKMPKMSKEEADKERTNRADEKTRRLEA